MKKAMKGRTMIRAGMETVANSRSKLLFKKRFRGRCSGAYFSAGLFFFRVPATKPSSPEGSRFFAVMARSVFDRDEFSINRFLIRYKRSSIIQYEQALHEVAWRRRRAGKSGS